MEHLERVLGADYRADRQEVLLKIEEEWCSFHHLLSSSLNHVAEICTVARFSGAFDQCFSFISLLVHSFEVNLCFPFLPDEDILNQLHRYRPSFLGISDGFPSYYDPYEFQHTCLIKCLPKEDTDETALNEDNHLPTNDSQKCVSLPFVTANHFRTTNISGKLTMIIKEVPIILSGQSM